MRSPCQAGVPQVGGVEAFGEPAVNFSKHRARFIAAAPLREQPRQAHRRRIYSDFALLVQRAISSRAESSSELR